MESFSTLSELKIVSKSGELKCEEKERHPRSIFFDFQSGIKTSIIDNLTSGFEVFKTYMYGCEQRYK